MTTHLANAFIVTLIYSHDSVFTTQETFTAFILCTHKNEESFLCDSTSLCFHRHQTVFYFERVHHNICVWLFYQICIAENRIIVRMNVNNVNDAMIVNM